MLVGDCHRPGPESSGNGGGSGSNECLHLKDSTFTECGAYAGSALFMWGDSDEDRHTVTLENVSITKGTAYSAGSAENSGSWRGEKWRECSELISPS